MSILKNLQTKSSTAKTHLAIGVAGLVTSIIVIVWMTTIPARFADSGSTDADVAATGSLDDFINESKDQLGNVIEGMDQAKEAISETSNLNSLNMNADSGASVENTESAQMDMYTNTNSTQNTSPPTPEPMKQPEATTPAKTEEPKQAEQSSKVILIGTTTASH